jgi:hypothetical protein
VASGRAAYGRQHRRARNLLLDPPVPCAHCRRQVATELDNDPPLAMHRHRQGTGCCRLIPSCGDCNRSGGVLVAQGLWRPGANVVATEQPDEPPGLAPDDERWRVPWLEDLLDVPRSAVWPRLMTVPHRRAVDSLGPEFIAYAEARSGRPLRWWQQLVAVRLLEVDSRGRLVWECLVLSMARQLGKSWLLRELMLWRIHQGKRFREPQDVLHTGKDLAICKEIQRPARIWAKARTDTYKVREVNGQEEIELLADGSRWLIRAKDAVYGYAAAVAAVDEAWKVKASTVDEGVAPTMAERNQPQLLLVSTAHRAATKLMVERRAVALAHLEDSDGDLLIEWSAPPGADDDDVDAWRAASPHWSSRRRALVRARLEAAQAGEVDDPDEPDALESFRAQWLNRWPTRLASPQGPTEPLLPDGVWQDLVDDELPADGPLFVGLEDDYGLGAAVGAVARLPDGRLEVDGWLRGDWDSAIDDVERLAAARPIRRLLVGASLVDRLPPGMRGQATPCSSTQTKAGLALLRDLALGGVLVHDVSTGELDQTLELATVKESAAGLWLVAKGPTHLVRAVCWALVAAHRPAPVPAVH